MIKMVMIILIFGWAHNLLGGPFVRINSIDAKSNFPYITLSVSARDTDGNWLSGLDESNLLVYENGFRVNYVQVKSQRESADTLYLVFSIDSSKSITPKEFKDLKKAAIEIITASGEHEKIALCRFNDKVVLLENFSDNKHKLITAVDEIEQHGNRTLLYNAVYDSIELVSRTDSGRKAIVIFTDGKDEGSSVTLQDVVEQSRRTAIPLYVIGMSTSEDIKVMKRMTKLSGGTTILVDKVDNLIIAYRKIIQNIRSQHLVRYVSMVSPDGSTNRLEVRLQYGAIRDRDIQNFAVDKRFLPIDFPDYKQILLTVMLVSLIILFGMSTILLIKRRSRIKKKYRRPKIEKESKKYSGYGRHDDNKEEEHAQKSSLYYSSGRLDEESIKRQNEKEKYAHAWLILQNNGQRKKFPLGKEEIIIGTSHDAHLAVKNSDVSSRHCSIKFIDGSYYLFDLVSQGGTFLNGNKLLRPRQLFDWDEIRVGPVAFIFRGSTL